MVFYSCISQNRLKPKDFMELNNETFDLDFYEKNKQENDDLYFEETKKDGTFIFITSIRDRSFTIIISKPPYYFTQIKEFNKEGKLTAKGISLEGCRIEKWLECDENGENCKVVNYEKNRGKFSYNNVLKFLEKKKFINPKIKNREDRTGFDLKYSYEQKTWEVKAWHKYDLGYYTYVLDGDTGEILKIDYTSTMY